LTTINQIAILKELKNIIMRKTVEIKKVVDKANEMLKNSTCSPAERNMLSSFIESFLMDLGMYQGYTYLDMPHEAGKTDESRRHYFLRTY
jgi:hypothetical protein